MKSFIKKAVKGTALEPVVWSIREALLPRSARINRQDDRQLEYLLRYVLRPDSNCIDIGAHKGSMLKQFCKLAPNGVHYAFEPIPDLTEKLRSEFPEVQIVQAALSDCAGESEFHINSEALGYSGMRRRSYPKGCESTSVIKVTTDRLDDILPSEHRVDFIKLDVEGAEYQVLSGAKRTLTTWRPYLVFEHGLGAAPAYGTRPEMMYDLLVDECGLRLFTMDGHGPLNRELFVDIFESGVKWNFLAHP